jgi:pimeloyl-ACP methyl ester carboxylesterase
MATVRANDINIEYETFGDSSAPPLLLIMGFACQLIFWDDELCEELAQRNHYVIRLDNRDVGLSSKLDEAGVPDISKIIEALLQGETVHAPYTFDDMADDAVGLLDTLSIEKAHICGMSMGGMIAQTIAMNHPSRILSLTSIYSTTGNPNLPQPKDDVLGILLTTPPEEREAYIEHNLVLFRAISGPGFHLDEDWIKDVVAREYDRAFYPDGAVRQMAAILTQKNRKPDLASVTVPSLVIHGADDPLVPIECGMDTAEAIPGAELVVIDGMGHDPPHGGAWPQIVDKIATHTAAAGA